MAQQNNQKTKDQQQEKFTLANFDSEELCPLCLGPYNKSFPVKLQQNSSILTGVLLTCGGPCRQRVHSRCAAKVFGTVEVREGEDAAGEVWVKVVQSTVELEESAVKTTSGEFMHVPTEHDTVTQMVMMPIGQINASRDWICDRCVQNSQADQQTFTTSVCLLCKQDISSGLSKLTECILNDNDRTWCHLSCARWHEEIRSESKKRFLFTDKNSLRQNEDKVISDCFVCDDASKRELLVKCLDCDNYVHPTCLTQDKTLDAYHLFLNLAKSKLGYSCGCSDQQNSKKTQSLVDKNKLDNKPISIEWILIEFGLAELHLRTIVEFLKDREQNFVCEVCAQVVSVSTNSPNMINLLQVCKQCFTVCHKKCNSEATCGITDFQCKACRIVKPQEDELESCQICSYVGGPLTSTDKMHFVCKNYKPELLQNIKCLHCGPKSEIKGGVVKCIDEEWDAGVHPFCHLTHLKGLHPSNCNYETKKFEFQFGRCFKHSQR